MQMSPSNVATFWFFTCFLSGFITGTCLTYDRTTFISIWKGRVSFGWWAADFETISDHIQQLFFHYLEKKAWLQGNEMDKMGLQITLLRSVSTTTSYIKVLHSTRWPCSEQTECRTPTGWGEADSLFASLMLGAQTQAPDALMWICWPYYDHHLVVAFTPIERLVVGVPALEKGCDSLAKRSIWNRMYRQVCCLTELAMAGSSQCSVAALNRVASFLRDATICWMLE